MEAQAAGPSDGKRPASGGGGEPLKSVAFDLVVPDLRNGSLADIQQAAVRSGMQALYNWPIITGLAPENAVDAAEHSFRAHLVHLQNGLGSDATDAQMSDARKWAVILAGVRAGAHAAWRLGEGDITRKECASSGMEVVAGTVRMASAGGTATDKWTKARSVPAMTKVEMDMLAMCAYMGMAVPTLQGASLIATGHHYVPSTYKMFDGLKRQALGSSSQDVKSVVEAMGERFDDLAFHKACHPMSPDLKRELAAKPEVADKLQASGHGSVAIRLPAIPSEATGGKAALALISAARRVIEEMGGRVSIDRGTQLMRTLENASPGAPRSAASNAVVEWAQTNENTLAFCAGIVQQIHDMSGSGQNTLLSAYSVKKLMAANPAEVTKGVTFARAANQRARTLMETGEYKVEAIEM